MSTTLAKPPMTTQRLSRFFFGDVDALPLRVFEVLFTTGFLIRFMSRIVYWREWLTDWGFHLTHDELWAMGYPDSFPLMRPWMVPLYAAVVFSGAMAVIANRCRRIGLVVLFAGATYAQGVDYISASSQDRIYIALFLLLASAPGCWREAVTGRLMVSAAPLRVVQATVLAIYIVAGIAKCQPGDWLRHTDVLWTHVQGFHRTDLAAWMLRMLPLWAWSVMQYMTLVFEVFAPVWFCWRRTRFFALAYGFSMHLMIALLMKGLIYFAFQMWAFYAVFITAEQWRSLGKWIGGRMDSFWDRRRGVIET